MNDMSVELEGKHYGPQAKEDMLIALQKACSTTANRVRDTARALVPLGPGIPKHLRDTIVARNVLRSYGRHKPPMSVVAAGDRPHGVYWHYMVEYGTYWRAAHPFMRPAYQRNFDPFKAEARRQGKRALNARRRATDKARRIHVRTKG